MVAVIDETPPAATADGLAPSGSGWYVVNAREARWVGQDGLWRGAWLQPDEARAVAFNLTVLDPGNPMARYHGESEHEAFLVVSGECLLLVEGQERRMRQWDFFQCPPWTEHILIGAGDRPAVVVAVSTRSPDASTRYVASELARRHGAAPPHDTALPSEAYADDPEPRVFPYREGDLP